MSDDQKQVTNPAMMWGFCLSIFFQSAAILAVPAQSIYTEFTGKRVILQTAIGDPYELLQGYAPTLKYDISSQDSLRNLPGWQNLPKQSLYDRKAIGTDDGKSAIKSGTEFYVILAEPISPKLPGLPEAWQAVAVSIKHPSQLKSDRTARTSRGDRVILKGLALRDSIKYGLENYKISQTEQQRLNIDLRATEKTNHTQPQQLPSIVVEIKVDKWGNGNLSALWAEFGEISPQVRNYRFGE